MPAIPAAIDAFATTIEALVDVVAAGGQTLLDAVAAAIQALVDAASPLFEGGCAPIVTHRCLVVGAAIQPGLDPVAAMIQPSLDALAAPVQTVLDAVAPMVEPPFDAVAAVGGRGRAGDGQQYRSTENCNGKGFHPDLLVQARPAEDGTRPARGR